MSNTNNGAPQKGRQEVHFRSSIDAFTGYGLHACQIIRDLLASGLSVKVHPTSIKERFVPIPTDIRNTFSREESNRSWELLLHPPGISLPSDRSTVWFTMWETSKLPRKVVSQLNRAALVIVPCSWNAESFRACGVNSPIEVVPLGIKPEIFRPTPVALDGLCVFGTGGRTVANMARKGLGLVVRAFQKAFPDERDVQLRIKSFTDCPVPSSQDSRIEVLQSFLSEEKMAAWFSGLTCYVSGSRGEGWGLFQHQALASARPLIGVNFGGVAEFFSPDMGYPVDYELVPGVGRFAKCGVWANPDLQSMADRMREVYENRQEAQRRGLRGSAEVSKLTWKRSNERLIDLMRKVKMI